MSTTIETTRDPWTSVPEPGKPWGEPVPEADPIWEQIRSGAWLDRQEFPPLRYAVPGIIPEGFGLLVAPPKAGKSWFALSVLLDVAAGRTTLGGIDPGNPRPVLYLALEDGDRRMQGRARKLLDGGSIPPSFQYVTKMDPGHVIGSIRAWLDEYGNESPLVVLDTLGKVMPPQMNGESAYNRDYRIGGQLKATVDDHPGSSLLVVHHTRKATSEDFMDSVSGTNGLNGAADFTLVLSRSRNDNRGTLKVTGRDVLEAEYALTVTDARWELDGGSLDAAQQSAQERELSHGLGDLQASILAAVNDSPAGITPSTLAKVVPGVKDNQAAGTYLGRLADAGRILKAGRGRYVPSPVESVESVETGANLQVMSL